MKHKVSQFLDVDSLSILEDMKHLENCPNHKKVRHLLLHSALSGGSSITSTKLVRSFFKMALLTSTVCPFLNMMIEEGTCYNGPHYEKELRRPMQRC